MTSNYRQPSYQVPYSGRLAGGGVSVGGLTDNFMQSSPQLLDMYGVPVPGFCPLDPRWAYGTYYPSPNNLGVVDARLQMASLTCEAAYATYFGNSWAVQQMPIPEIGQTVQYAVYASSQLGTLRPQLVEQGGAAPLLVESYSAPPQAAIHGLFWGADRPNNYGGYVIGQQSYDFDDYNVPQFSGLFYCDNGKAETYLQMPGQASYYRLRVRLTIDSIDSEDGNAITYGTVSYGQDIGFTGADWITLDEYTSPPGEAMDWAVPRYAGLFFNLYPASADNVEYGAALGSALFPFFRVELQDYEDRSSRIGSQQQLGAV